MTEAERRNRRTVPAWFCYACGAPKENAKPGQPCPAGCGSRVTTSRRPVQADDKQPPT